MPSPGRLSSTSDQSLLKAVRSSTCLLSVECITSRDRSEQATGVTRCSVTMLMPTCPIYSHVAYALQMRFLAARWHRRTARVYPPQLQMSRRTNHLIRFNVSAPKSPELNSSAHHPSALLLKAYGIYATSELIYVFIGLCLIPHLMHKVLRTGLLLVSDLWSLSIRSCRDKNEL